MMIKANQVGISLVVTVWAWGLSGRSEAQMAPPPPPAAPPMATTMMNPYLNPAMNPLLNPSAPQQKMSTGNALLYLYSAQAARGGIGSGRLSNPGTVNSRKKPATSANAASIPGGAAAGYFGNSRSGGRVGLQGYFNQSTGRFQNNRN